MTRTKTPPPLLAAIPAAILLVLAALVAGGTFNALRPASLPWFHDWSRHVETLAHDAAIPLVFLPEVQAIATPSAGTPRGPDAPRHPVLIDARPAADYDAAHIPGALHLAIEEIDVRLPGIAASVEDLSAPLITYCSSIDCDDALTLAVAIAGRGFPDVRLYSGGFAEWTAYGNPVEPTPAEDDAP